MVAEVNSSRSADSPAARKQRRTRCASSTPLPQRAAVRALYVVDGLGPKAIAEQLGMTEKAVRNLIYTQRWTAERNAKFADDLSQTEAQANARVKEHHDAVAAKTEALTFGVLDRCADRLAAGDDKGLSMATNALRNVHAVSRIARGLDRQQSGESGGVTLAICIARGQRVEKNITPGQTAIDVSAAP